MHELTASQWLVLALIGLCVGGFAAGAAYLLNELMFRRRMARWDRQLNGEENRGA